MLNGCNRCKVGVKCDVVGVFVFLDCRIVHKRLRTLATKCGGATFRAIKRVGHGQRIFVCVDNGLIEYSLVHTVVVSLEWEGDARLGKNNDLGHMR